MIGKAITDIGLRWPDRIVNPRLVPRSASLLIAVGIALLGVSSLFDFNASGKVANGNGSLEFAISQNADGIAQIIGACLILIAVGLIVFDRLHPEPVAVSDHTAS